MNLSKVLLFFVLVFSAHFQAHAQTTDAIIGKNDLVFVKDDLSNIPNKFKPMMSAIGKLSTACTVTHIGQGFVLTAGHCFWQTFFDGALYQNQACSGETINWQLTAGNQAPKISNCLEIVAMQRNEELNLDYAIMKVSEPPAESVQIDWSDEVPRAGSIITLFSYPAEDPLSWSKYCRVKRLTQHDVSPGLLHHVCDTQKGSSGAVILSGVTGKVVGLHIRSDVDPNPDGTPSPNAVENFGVYISKSPIKNILIKAGYIF